MIFRILYTMEPKRILNAAVMDGRFQNPALSGMSGFEVKNYVDNQIALITSDVLPYKIETMDGNFVGYISIIVSNIGQTGVEFQRWIRPSFSAFSNEISNAISIFVSQNLWKPDFLT